MYIYIYACIYINLYNISPQRMISQRLGRRSSTVNLPDRWRSYNNNKTKRHIENTHSVHTHSVNPIYVYIYVYIQVCIQL